MQVFYNNTFYEGIPWGCILDEGTIAGANVVLNALNKRVRVGNKHVTHASNDPFITYQEMWGMQHFEMCESHDEVVDRFNAVCTAVVNQMKDVSLQYGGRYSTHIQTGIEKFSCEICYDIPLSVTSLNLRDMRDKMCQIVKALVPRGSVQAKCDKSVPNRIKVSFNLRRKFVALPDKDSIYRVHKLLYAERKDGARLFEGAFVEMKSGFKYVVADGIIERMLEFDLPFNKPYEIKRGLKDILIGRQGQLNDLPMFVSCAVVCVGTERKMENIHDYYKKLKEQGFQNLYCLASTAGSICYVNRDIATPENWHVGLC